MLTFIFANSEFDMKIYDYDKENDEISRHIYWNNVNHFIGNCEKKILIYPRNKKGIIIDRITIDKSSIKNFKIEKHTSEFIDRDYTINITEKKNNSKYRNIDIYIRKENK